MVRGLVKSTLFTSLDHGTHLTSSVNKFWVSWCYDKLCISFLVKEERAGCLSLYFSFMYVPLLVCVLKVLPLGDMCWFVIDVFPDHVQT